MHVFSCCWGPSLANYNHMMCVHAAWAAVTSYQKIWLLGFSGFWIFHLFCWSAWYFIVIHHNKQFPMSYTKFCSGKDGWSSCEKFNGFPFPSSLYMKWVKGCIAGQSQKRWRASNLISAFLLLQETMGCSFQRERQLETVRLIEKAKRLAGFRRTIASPIHSSVKACWFFLSICGQANDVMQKRYKLTYIYSWNGRLYLYFILISSFGLPTHFPQFKINTIRLKESKYVKNGFPVGLSKFISWVKYVKCKFYLHNFL